LKRAGRIPLDATLFFVGVTLLYLSFSPLSEEGMGYIGEEMASCRQIGGLLLGHRGSIAWPRNGAVGLLFQCPFMAAGLAFRGPSAASEDVGLSWQPVLATALLVTILFVWGSRLAASRAWGFVLALAAGFATLLWPYAYIGLETTQSLFLLLAGYLALTPSGLRSWPRSMLFALTAAVAISAKSGGVLLVPAVAYLTWSYFRGPGARQMGSKSLPRAQRIAVILIIAAVFLANSYLRSVAWARFGGTVHFASWWLVHDAISPFLNFLAFFASPNKGLFVYAPLTLLALVAIPRALSVDRPVVVFAALTLLGLAGSLSLLEMWSDETWGPRYLHSAVGPLALCLAASRRDRVLGVRKEAPLAAAVVLGLVVSFLGVSFYYGSLMNIATRTRPLTMESLQGDVTWNHVRLNARLLRIWLGRKGADDAPQYLPAPRLWDFRTPPFEQTWNKVDLRPFSEPQPLLMRLATSPRGRWTRRALAASALAGVVCLVWAWRAVTAAPATVRARVGVEA
jgi:hypothetical protein